MLNQNLVLNVERYPFNILEPEKYSELFEEIDKDFDRVDFLYQMQ